jgi:hypothetical protein
LNRIACPVPFAEIEKIAGAAAVIEIGKGGLAVPPLVTTTVAVPPLAKLGGKTALIWFSET